MPSLSLSPEGSLACPPARDPIVDPTLDLPTLPSEPESYARLVADVRGAGLLDRRPGYYSAKISLTLAALAAGWVLFFLVGNSWLTLGVAVLLGLLSTQVVFLGHDAGHQQICTSHRANRLIGLVVANVLTGLSFGWWVPKHNAHHAHPNQVDRDPDIDVGPFAFTYSSEARPSRSALARYLTRRQAWLFFPVLLLEGVGLHISSIRSVLRKRNAAAALEASLMLGHVVLYLFAAFWVLPPTKALAFIGVQQGILGLYLGCTFAPNHKGMSVIDRDENVGFARRQVITARNVAGGRWTTFLLGGLNYQIEHHLFPLMPRANLAKAQGMILAFCAEHELPYRQDSLFGSYGQALRHLSAVGARNGRNPALAVDPPTAEHLPVGPSHRD